MEAKRLIKLRTIQAEHIDMSRSWIWREIAAGRFPKPVADGLWDAAEVHGFVVAYLERAKERAAAHPKAGKKVAKALAARAQRTRARGKQASVERRRLDKPAARQQAPSSRSHARSHGP